VVDVSAPDEPIEVGDWSPYTKYVAIQDEYAYILNTRDFYILDVSDPANPTEVAAYDDLGLGMEAVQVSGGYAYIAYGGLRILDISDPLAVTQVGLFNTEGHVVDVALMGNYALIAVDDYYVLVLDVSDPTQIEQIGSYSTAPRSVAVDGSLAYVAGKYEFEVIDFTNPNDPILVDSVESFYSGFFTDAYLNNDQAYVTGKNYGLLLYDTHSIVPGDKKIYLPVILRFPSLN